MAKRSDFIPLAALTIIFSYLLSVGATFNGILFPEFHNLTLGLIALVVVIWLFLHWRGGWHWYKTSLDTVFLLWIVAFGASLLANTDAWRRIVIGLWYMGVYIGVWYVLHDLIANRVLRREIIVDALLIAGLVITMFAYLQLQVWLRQIIATQHFIPVPRPVSVFGNPNFLSNFLIVTIPLTLSRMFMTRGRVTRILLGVYAFLQLLMLFLTDSRGAWVGIAVGLVIWGVLFVSRNGRVTRSGMVTWWQQQASAIKAGVIGSVVVGLIVVVVFSAAFIHTFSDPGRSADLRFDIYTAAIDLFKEKPITGQGLFTFGRGLVSIPGINPDKPHSHAHNAILHIAAELGILGLAALALTLFVGVRTMQSNWRLSSARERLIAAGAIGGVVAFAIHQLTDVPAMMPAIALTGLLALVLALAPKEPELVNPTWARTGHPIEMIGIWVVIVIAGFWSSGIYSRYVGILSDAVKTENYRQAADQLNTVIADDPQLSLYYMEQGFLYGMAASNGDLDAAQKGIDSYQHFMQLDPGYAVAWANMGALNWQVGHQEEAVKDLQESVRLYSVEWNYQALLGEYAEATGKTDVADAAYRDALKIYPDASLYPELDDFAEAHPDAVGQSKMSVGARVASLLDHGNVQEALVAWKDVQLNNAPSYVIQALLDIAQQDKDRAITALNRADMLDTVPVEEAWVHLGKARLASMLGDKSLMIDELNAAKVAMADKPLDSDDPVLINIAYAQFLQVAVERQYLPQLNYRTDPVLLYFLANTQ